MNRRQASLTQSEKSATKVDSQYIIFGFECNDLRRWKLDAEVLHGQCGFWLRQSRKKEDDSETNVFRNIKLGFIGGIALNNKVLIRQCQTKVVR